MAPKTCPDCKAEVSTAAACPRCGRRMVPASSARRQFIIPGVFVALGVGYAGWESYKKHQRAEQERRREDLIRQMDDIIAKDKASREVVPFARGQSGSRIHTSFRVVSGNLETRITTLISTVRTGSPGKSRPARRVFA